MTERSQDGATPTPERSAPRAEEIAAVGAGAHATEPEAMDPGAPDPDAPGAQDGKGGRKGIGSFLAELPVLILIAFVLALLLKTFLIQAFYIPSESMLPTLDVGDRVLVNKVVYRLRDPKRGEVVVFSEDGLGPPVPESENPVTGFLRSLGSGLGFASTGDKDFIKRIIGLPGETIEMRGGVVRIDGEPLPESPQTDGGYLSQPDYTDFGPYEIPEGQYFMMGDNRPNSSDSRSLLGTISEDAIVGRAFVIIWPVGRMANLSAGSYPDSVATSGIDGFELADPVALAGLEPLAGGPVPAQ